MSGGKPFGGSCGGFSCSGDTRSPGAKDRCGAGVPATLRRRTQNFDAGDTRSQSALYTAHNLRPAFALHYDWTGWPTAGTTLPPETSAVARETASLWEKDGLRLLWYNLHLVLVVAGRYRITDPEQLGRFRDASLTLAEEAGHRIAALSVMPDHFHMALRGNIQRSPEDIALAFQNVLAQVAGCRVWQNGFYVGTFSEYDLNVIRRISGQS